MIVSKINFQVTKLITHENATDEIYQWSVVFPLASIDPCKLLHIQNIIAPWITDKTTHFQNIIILKYLFFCPALYSLVFEYTTSGKWVSDSNAKANKHVSDVHKELYRVGSHSAK